MNTQTQSHSNRIASAAALSAPDLTQRPPRSPRCRLGGYALLPRLLDKCRAKLAGSLGEYHFNCPLDQEFLGFVGLSGEAVAAEVAKGKGDVVMLRWIQENAPAARSPWEIEQWSAYQERRAPEPGTELHAYFLDTRERLAPGRRDIRAWVERLDLDDYCSFGGAA